MCASWGPSGRENSCKILQEGTSSTPRQPSHPSRPNNMPAQICLCSTRLLLTAGKTRLSHSEADVTQRIKCREEVIEVETLTDFETFPLRITSFDPAKHSIRDKV